MNPTAREKVRRIPWARPYVTRKEKQYVLDALDAVELSKGTFNREFESKFISSLNGSWGASVSSGTSALFLALRAFGISPGDEVIVPGYTFAAPVNMVLECGATPVFADVDDQTFCVTPNTILSCLTPKTKAVIAVHPYGNVCVMDQLSEICRKYRLVLIEDAAEAVFSKYLGRAAGTWGDAGCFSFHAAKTLATGEGGFILSPHRNIIEKVSLLRDHGMNSTRPYRHSLRAYNFRMTNMQAALGCAQLENIRKIISLRHRAFRTYEAFLSDIPMVRLQKFQNGVDPVIWTCAVILEEEHQNLERIRSQLAIAGIETRPGFSSFNTFPYLKAPILPVSEELSQKVICLPFYCEMETADIEYVCQELRRSLR